ncbi:MAG: hypothetical protein ABIH23_22610 [bacterium]
MIETTRPHSHKNKTALRSHLLYYFSFAGVFCIAMLAWICPAGAQVEQMGWWSEFSLARVFDSPVVFGTVLGIFGLFVLFYIVVAIRSAALERAAKVWAGDLGLAELVAALGTPDANLAFVHIRWLRSERLYTWLRKRLAGERGARMLKQLLADLPDKEGNKQIEDQLLSSESDKKTRQAALVQLFEHRDEQLQRLLLTGLRQTKTGGSVSVYLIYLLEDLAVSEARPLLERLLTAGEIPTHILENALRRIPQPQEAKAK